MKNKIDLEHISVKKALEIANTYMYKTIIIETNDGKAYIELLDNFLKSPYPRHMISVPRTKQYVQKMFLIYGELPF